MVRASSWCGEHFKYSHLGLGRVHNEETPGVGGGAGGGGGGGGEIVEDRDRPKTPESILWFCFVQIRSMFHSFFQVYEYSVFLNFHRSGVVSSRLVCQHRRESDEFMDTANVLEARYILGKTHTYKNTKLRTDRGTERKIHRRT